jgi:hypothetical protein
MSIRYFHPPDEDQKVPPTCIQEETWQHVLRFPFQRNYPSGGGEVPFFISPDEDYWQHTIRIPERRVYPGGGGQVKTIGVDEDFQQVPLSLDIPWVVTLWMDDSGAVPPPAPIQDEDFWQNPVGPVQAILAIPEPWTWDVQENAGSLQGRPDEDYWQNWVAPVPAVLGRLYLVDSDDVPAGSLYGLAEEFYWQNPVLPVPAIQYQQLPYLPDPEELPVGSLFGQPDEDFWQNPVPPVAATLGKLYLPDPDETAGFFFGQPDEDFWVNAVAPGPIPLTFGKLYLPDPEESAGFFFGQPDEDFWQNPVFPVVASLGKLYLPDPEENPAGFVLIRLDEDFWQNAVAPISAYTPSLVFSDDDVIVPQPPLPFDEDFWQNAVAAIPGVQYVPLPYLPDPEEIPAGSLIPPIPPPPPPVPSTCPCSQTPTIPRDKLFDITLCPITTGIWWACIFTQPNTPLNKRMGGSPIIIYVYGTQQQAFAEARQFVLHNLGVQ